MPLGLAGCLDVFEYGQYCMALGLKPESGLAFLINCQRIDIPGKQFFGVLSFISFVSTISFILPWKLISLMECVDPKRIWI